MNFCWFEIYNIFTFLSSDVMNSKPSCALQPIQLPLVVVAVIGAIVGFQKKKKGQHVNITLVGVHIMQVNKLSSEYLEGKHLAVLCVSSGVE